MMEHANVQTIKLKRTAAVFVLEALFWRMENADAKNLHKFMLTADVNVRRI